MNEEILHKPNNGTQFSRMALLLTPCQFACFVGAELGTYVMSSLAIAAIVLFTVYLTLLLPKTEIVNAERAYLFSIPWGFVCGLSLSSVAYGSFSVAGCRNLALTLLCTHMLFLFYGMLGTWLGCHASMREKFLNTALQLVLLSALSAVAAHYVSEDSVVYAAMTAFVLVLVYGVGYSRFLRKKPDLEESTTWNDAVASSVGVIIHLIELTLHHLRRLEKWVTGA